MQFSQELKAVNDAIELCEPDFSRGREEKLNEEEITQVLSTLLFEITNNSKNRLVEVRDCRKRCFPIFWQSGYDVQRRINARKHFY